MKETGGVGEKGEEDAAWLPLQLHENTVCTLRSPCSDLGLC